MNSLLPALDSMGRAWLPAITQLSGEIAVLSLVIAIAAWALRIRLPAARHLLWLLLLAKPVVWLVADSPWTAYQLLADASPRLEAAAVQTAPSPIANAAAVPDRGAADTAPPASGSWAATVPWHATAFGLWLAGVALMLARVAFGFGASWHLRKTSVPVEDEATCAAMAEAAALIRVKGEVGLASSAAARSPLVTGILRPLVLLPPDLARRLSPEQLTLILAHELAHVARRDNLVLLAQRLAEAFLFFHPSIWLCGRELRREAEASCDDRVLASTGAATGFADGLTTIAEVVTTGGSAMNVLTAVESHLGHRIKRILAGSHPGLSRRGRIGFAGMLAVMVLTTLPATTQESISAAAPAASLEELLLELAPTEADSTVRRQMGIEARALMDAGMSLKEVERSLRVRLRVPVSIHYYASEDLRKVTTNPAGTNGQRFVVMSVQLGIADSAAGADLLQPLELEEIDAALEPFTGLMRSIVLKALQGATVSDLTDGQDALVSSLQASLERGVVEQHLSLPGRQLELREVIVTELVVQ